MLLNLQAAKVRGCIRSSPEGQAWVKIDPLKLAHVDADKASLITVKKVLDLARRAKEIYESSKVDEKRQILNSYFRTWK